jgi:hypothetical protein
VYDFTSGNASVTPPDTISIDPSTLASLSIATVPSPLRVMPPSASVVRTPNAALAPVPVTFTNVPLALVKPAKLYAAPERWSNITTGFRLCRYHEAIPA